MSRCGALVALVAVASLGCAMSADSAGPGFGSGAGGSGAGATNGGCLSDMCVPALGTPVVLAVEIDPPSSSPSGVTQILGRDVSTADPYQTSPAVAVTADFALPTGGTVPSSSGVVLVVPPTIPGRPDLSFQSVGASPDNGRSVAATLTVPQDVIGAASTLSLVPLPPADQTIPPYNFAMAVAPMMMANLPGDDITVSGQILLANQTPPTSTFIARAFQNGGQVSNAAPTQADGTFQVRIPMAAAANQVTIQLSPSAPTASAPKDAWFVSKSIMVTPGKNLGVITMPSYIAPVSYDIVVANGSNGISGVNVRAQANIGPATANGATIGTASYVSNGGTDMKGVAALFFLPATTNASTNTLISYTVTATPPIGSEFAVSCMNVTPSGSGSTMTLATFTPGERPVVSGTVRSADGRSLSGVTVTASGTPDPSAADCLAPTAVTASTTTSASGVFSLPLDSGTYQLDYNPPAGSAAPRMTELAVAVAQTPLVQHDVTLPSGARVTGTVVSRTDGTPVGSATVRFFQPRCNGQDDCFGPLRTPPLLVGKTLTGSDGSFRIVIPVPSSS